MKQWLIRGTASLLLCAPLLAHHSFSSEFDGSTAVQMKGVVRAIQFINPHIFIHVDVGSGAKTERWALEGPSLYGFDRKNLQRDFLKNGDVIGICGYAIRKGAVDSIVDPATGRSAKKFSAEEITLPNGQKLEWADYGTRRCIRPRN